MAKSRLPAVTAQEVTEAFGKVGFKFVRATGGSHHILKKPGHRYHLTIPKHRHKSIKSSTLRALIRAAGLEVDEFVALLKEIAPAPLTPATHKEREPLQEKNLPV